MPENVLETRRLYDDFPYETDFEASVLSCFPGAVPASLCVILDATMFFPEEGGQTPDQGTLLGFPVTDVQISPERVITHTIDMSSLPAPANSKSLFYPGTIVSGHIDWRHRFSNMQNHTGEHILSGLLHNLYGYENVGFRLSDNTVTLDTSGHLTSEQLSDLETKANEVIWKNVSVTCEYPPAEVLRTLSYRSKKEIESAIRIVTIEGVDVCACCAPHVRKTGEIGLIKILSAVRTKDSTRITLVCGQRALLQVQHAQQQAKEASHLMNVPQESIAHGVQRLLDENASLRESCRAKDQQYVDARLLQIQKEAASCEAIRQTDQFLFERDLSTLSQRSFMNSLCDMGWRYAGVFCGSDEAGWNYLIGSRRDDARIPGDLLLQSFHARGGGKPQMVQGYVHASREDLLGVLSGLKA